ncbi:MAG: ABC transporter permease [Alphaproteobacteria bacterium]
MAQAGIASPAALTPPRREISVRQIRWLTLLAILSAWEAVAASGLLYGDVVPSSVKIAVAVVVELTTLEFYHDLGITFLEVIVGFAGGTLAGLAAGMVLGTSPFLRRAAEPYLNALGSTPKIIFLPILFLMFGVGMESKMAKGALSGFFPVVFSTILGMTSIRQVLLWVGMSFNLSRWQMVTRIYLPAMVAPVMVGLRLGMGVTIIGILVAEIKFSSGGLGFRIIQYYDNFQIAPMYAMLVIIFGVAALANYGMTRLQRRHSHEGLSVKRGARAAG